MKVYQIAATDPGAAGYQSVLSMLVAAVAGRGVFYYVTIGSILLVLSLSRQHRVRGFAAPVPHHRARWLFAQVPCQPRAPLGFFRGDLRFGRVDGRAASRVGGVTDRLIPLYAVGAFLAFTLSQLGMVFHWKRVRGPHAGRFMFINGVGAFVTGITVVVVLVAKFLAGAWITMLLIPGILLLMYAVHRHYQHVSREVADSTPLVMTNFRPAQVVVPIERWSAVAKKAVSFALSISPEVIGLHVNCEWTEQLKKEWQEYVEKPVQEVGLAAPRLVILQSPYRYVSSPIVDYVLTLQKSDPTRQIAVLIPELVERHWYYYCPSQPARGGAEDAVVHQG